MISGISSGFRLVSVIPNSVLAALLMGVSNKLCSTYITDKASRRNRWLQVPSAPPTMFWGTCSHLETWQCPNQET
ncbi:hypothetical protein F4779DRAFT_601379 [Xylariaceae sp. FL0662B]|nr:hypothetical protein F4779DRAFT_601379 [Xylariaceae sp. FL0662B]